MKKITSTVLAIALSIGAYAQKADGTTKSLLNAEKSFAESVAKNGTKETFVKYAAADGLVFRPNPVNARTFYTTAPDVKNLAWSADFARVSRSGDLGFTSGSYTENGEQKAYGHYLSVWKANDGKWEFILDLGAETNRPLTKKANNFKEPKDHYTPKFVTDKELKSSRDVIYTTEKTLNTMFKTYGASAFAGFLSEDSQLMFPGTDLMVGKENIIAFNNRMIDKINLKTTSADKALGGDLAYTYGIATIDYKADLRESFHYIYIWERQPDFSWNIINQIYTLADR
jgi:ketosteroid isomerase-like protein